MAGRLERVDDVPRLVAERLERREIEDRQRVDAVVRGQPDDRARSARIRERRSIASEIGVHVDVARERGDGRVTGQDGEPSVQFVVRRRAGERVRDRVRGMRRHDVVQQQARRRLPALVQVRPGDHRPPIRAPDARAKHGRAARGHVAARRARDEREATFQRRRTGRSHGAHTARVRVDEADAHGGPGRQSEVRRRRRGQPGPQRSAGRPKDLADVAAIAEISQTDGPQKVVVPARARRVR
mmetsp:Transcript_4429/g.14047  ORF Transcript_4429/g.14047 Transcript_4429/m.14047 type:complete len:241 (-) Transcript_4429:289-1011(-)